MLTTCIPCSCDKARFGKGSSIDASSESNRLGRLRFLADRRLRLGLLLPDRHELHRDSIEPHLGCAFGSCVSVDLTVRNLLDITSNGAALLGRGFL